MFSKKILLLITLVLALSLFTSGPAKARTTLEIGHILAAGSLQNQALTDVFKPYIEEETNGEIKIKVFPGEQLGGAPDQVEAVKMGTQDMFMGSQTWWEAELPQIGVSTVPFMFKNRDHFHKWVDEVLKKDLEPKLIEKANQRFLNLEVKWHRGPFRVICSKTPVFTPEDVEGLELRLWPARTIQKSWKGLGAKIQTIDFAEAYLAPQQGVVNAITSPFDLVWPQKFTEVVKYVTELKQYPQLEFISINEKTWKKLSEEHKSLLTEAANKAGEWFNKHSSESVEETIQKLIREHNVKYIQVNRESFSEKIHKKVIPDLIADGTLKEEWVNQVESLD